MTKEVLITIDGTQLNTEEQPIRVTAPGVYYLRNGKHYIQYEEHSENGGSVLKNRIKISNHRLELMKKGIGETQMNFDLLETTDTIYQTPYGEMELQISTKELSVEDSGDEIKVNLLYQLISNGNYLSDNLITIQICSQ